MKTEPTYPAEAVPGQPAPPETRPVAPPPVAATPGAAPVAEKSVSWQKVGVGAAIGIGSAAVAAALLYANRGRKP